MFLLQLIYVLTFEDFDNLLSEYCTFDKGLPLIMLVSDNCA
jgi:hypothetical protein